MLFQYHIREMTAETSAEDFVTHFVHVEKFLPFCQQCSSYNTRWTCPPFDFDPMTIWRSYTGLRLYARILQADVPEQPLDEAVAALSVFLDGAMLANLSSVRIIHGKGTGVLRKAVQEELKHNRAVKRYRLGVYGEGEDGVTIAELA